MKTTMCTLTALTILAVPALADSHLSVAETAANTLSAAPEAWLGDTPHFVMMGTVNGTQFNLQYLDMATAAGVATFEAKREYEIEGDGYRYVDFEFTLEAVIGELERAIELEFENHDFQTFAAPAVFELAQEEFPEGPYSNIEVEFEWEADGTSVNEEVAAWNGQLDMAVDTGSADDKGLVPDGTVAGYLVAEKGGDRLVVSFTVPVAEYEIED